MDISENLEKMITSVFSVIFLIPIPILIIVFTVYMIKTGQRKNPPYHEVNESGDVIVYLFKWSRSNKSLSSQSGGKYHEYLFENTVNGLKYKRSDKKKLANIISVSMITLALIVFLFPCFSEGIFIGTYLIAIFSVYIFAMALLFSIEYANLCLAKKYLKENSFI